MWGDTTSAEVSRLESWETRRDRRTLETGNGGQKLNTGRVWSRSGASNATAFARITVNVVDSAKVGGTTPTRARRSDRAELHSRRGANLLTKVSSDFDLQIEIAMPQPKTPASSLSGRLTAHSSLLRLTTITAAVIELLIKRVLHRIRGTRSADAPNKISPTPPSPATILPLEIVEMVIAHLICDERSLLAFSLTCCSWYTASIPYLYHTLVIPPWIWSNKSKPGWPKQLRSMHKRGLLPLVKKFQIRQFPALYPGHRALSPTRFNCRTLRSFWALTNVQELGIEYMDIPRFMPRIQRYFKHLFPTVRSLSLRAPRGTCREIIYFIGLFQHLEDLKLLYHRFDSQGELYHIGVATLTPPFMPPLRGRLTVSGLERMGLLGEMINLFGGIRFCYLDIYDVEATQLLLDACANTLETLRLYSGDPRGKQLSQTCVQALANNFTGAFHFRDFNLSRIKLLRTLEITAQCIYSSYLLTHALSTITSPAFSEVTIIYRDSDLPRSPSPAEARDEAHAHHWQFELFRAMRRVRNFQLVLCARVRDDEREYSVQKLKQIIGEGNISPEPLVIHGPREPRNQFDSRHILFSL
jgi:hypothetical protein